MSCSLLAAGALPSLAADATRQGELAAPAGENIFRTPTRDQIAATVAAFDVPAGKNVFLSMTLAAAGDTVISQSNLAGIYQLAVENDLTIARAEAQLRADATQRTSRRAGLLPRADFQFSTSQSDTDSQGVFLAGGVEFPNNTNTVTDTNQWRVSLTQPVFDLGAWFNFRQGVALSEQAEVRFAQAQQNLLSRAMEAYLAVLRASANLRASQVQVQALENQLEQVNARFDVGLVAITDVQDAQAAYDLGTAQLIRNEGALEVALEQLTVLTGRRHEEPLWELPEDFPITLPEPADADEWAHFAATNNLDVRLADFSMEVARLGSRSAASAYLPTINFTYSFTHSARDNNQLRLGSGIRNLTPFDSQGGNWAFTFTMPLPSGGATWAAERRARANFFVQQSSYDGTLRLITQQTRAAYAQARTDVNRVRANERSLQSTETALAAAQTGFEVGTRNIVDVVNAQQVYFAAQRDYDNSRVDYVSSMIELKRLAGILSPDDIYAINARLEPPAVESLAER